MSLHVVLHASVIAPTPKAVVGGPVPTISVIGKSPVDGTPDSWSHVPAQSRARVHRARALRRSAVDPSSKQLWAGSGLASLTIRAPWALGRALHSAGLAGPLPWPGG